jgi:hypothetical protein
MDGESTVEMIGEKQNYSPATWWQRSKPSQFIFLLPTTSASSTVSCSGGDIGCGPPRHFYNEADLRAAAIRKHGQADFQTKQEARLQRESKKRQRQDDAESALAALQQAACPSAPIASPGTEASIGGAPIILVSDPIDAAPRPAAVAPHIETAALRKSPLKLAKQALGFKDSGAPKQWRVEAPHVQPVCANIKTRKARVKTLSG